MRTHSIMADGNTGSEDLGSINGTDNATVEKLEFNDRLLANVIAYSAMYFLGTVLNVAVLIGSCVCHRGAAKESHHRGHNNVHLMVAHLAISDLIVSAVIVPLEIGWRVTVAWVAGNAACKALMYLRAFAYYLSSGTLVALSLDRYWAVSQPLASFTGAHANRAKITLMTVWLLSMLLALPQTLIFRVVSHPRIESFHQCTAIGYFKEVHYFLGVNPDLLEKVFGVASLSAVYFLPLSVIVVTYANIQRCIRREGTLGRANPGSSSVALRRHLPSSKQRRHNSRALYMSFVHVLAFVCCWTPYVVVTVWYILDSTSVMAAVPDIVQDVFVLLAVFNSCVNPIVYGGFYFK